MTGFSLFSGHRRCRVTVATYPNGLRYVFRKVRHGGKEYWQHHPRGSASFPLSVAKAEAVAEGATISTEYRP